MYKLLGPIAQLATTLPFGRVYIKCFRKKLLYSARVQDYTTAHRPGGPNRKAVIMTDNNDNNPLHDLDERGISASTEAIFGDVPCITVDILRILSNDPLSGSTEVLTMIQKEAYVAAYGLIVALERGQHQGGEEDVLDALGATILMAAGTKAEAAGEDGARLATLAALAAFSEGYLDLEWSFDNGQCLVRFIQLGVEDSDGEVK